MGRVFALFAAAILLLGISFCSSAAQPIRGARIGASSQRMPRPPLPMNAQKLQDLPLQRVTKQQSLRYWQQIQDFRKSGRPAAQAPAPPPTTPQFQDLTTNPRPPLVGPSTACQEIQPNWSWDQQRIFLSSNNVDDVGSYGATAPPANALFHIYAISSDGAFVQQLTGNNPSYPDEAAGQQLYPAISHSQRKLAYVHRPTPNDPYQLYVLTFSTDPNVPPTREQLTGLPDPSGILGFNTHIGEVQRPTWQPGDGLIAFGAVDRRNASDPRNIYTIDLSTGIVRRLTNATAASGVECIDPNFHPDEDRMVFAANAFTVEAATGDLRYRANPKQDLNGDGRADEVDHNLFTIPSGGPSSGAPIIRITSATADDVEPSYNQSKYPPGTDPPAGLFNDWLAFASLGRRPNPGEEIGTTYDIYFNNGEAESLNTPIRLFTPDTNAGAVPLNQTDERYPTWSASLPPQNPIDRIAFSSNRKNNVDDLSKPLVGPAGDTDIWTAEVTDITPPTLFPIGDEKIEGVESGETLHIANAPLPAKGLRVGQPGDTFYFYTKVRDLQYGVESVWLQIKDPDGPGTDSQSENHKLFGEGLNNVYFSQHTNTGPKHFIHIPYETDCEGIGVSDYKYYRGPNRPDFWSNARFASLDPGIDDSIRWSGNQVSPYNPEGVTNRPPLDAEGNPRWLRLHDDGLFPDQKAGDGIFSADWVTPRDRPSDWYVDLICYDRAFNPQNIEEQQNWIIYDNIWGFSTRAFRSNHQVLLVDDNGAGQKWPRGLKGSFRAFPQFRYGTESDITDRAGAYLPREFMGVNLDGSLILRDIPAIDAGFPGNGTFPFLQGNPAADDYIFWVRGAGRAYRYDLWRILARGGVSRSVLNNYLPERDTQPLDIEGRVTTQRPVPRRAVVWSAPYTGDIFSGGGSILDQEMQARLTEYRDAAGRLVVAGGDLLWALTINGTVSQRFVNDVLGVQTFGGDEGAPGQDNYCSNLEGPIARDITWDAASRLFQPPYEPPVWWRDMIDPDPIGTATGWAIPVPFNFFVDGSNDPDLSWTDGTPFATQDFFTPAAGWESIFTAGVPPNNGDGPVNATKMSAREDATTLSKTVFMSFSLGSFGRRYASEGNDPASSVLGCLNYRAKVSHAMFCWMFSADLVGQVKSINGGAPISGAWVKAMRGNTIVGSAFSRADGTYIIRGLPVGGWTIQVENPGYLSFNKATGSGAHGLDQAQLDILMSPASPGSISGKVVDQFGTPVANTKILALLQASPLYTGQREFRATTGLDGTYIIPAAPVGRYTVTVERPYPAGFDNPTPTQRQVTVNPAQDTGGVDFTLEGQPGDLVVTVIDAVSKKGIPDAEVSVIQNGVVVPGLSDTTDADGKVTFRNVPPGPTRISAFKLRYQEGFKDISIPQDKTVEIQLAAATPRDLYGLAVRDLDDKPLVERDLPAHLVLLRQASGLPAGPETDVFAPPATSPVRHNYVFTGDNAAQEGRFIVALRDHPRFLDAQVTVDVARTGTSVAPDLQLQGRPGVLHGTVREKNSDGSAGAPIADVQVKVISQIVDPGNVVATLTTAADGTWTTDPDDPLPSDLYTVKLHKFGYGDPPPNDPALKDIFLAGDTDAGTYLLVSAPRGSLYGLARRSTDKVARGGVDIIFVPVGGAAGDQAKTTSSDTLSDAPDGGKLNYSSGATATTFTLPEGEYDVRIESTRFAMTPKRVTVTGDTATRLDLDLTPLPGIVSGQVHEDDDGRPGRPVANATVRLIQNGGTVATMVTDSTGHYETSSAVAAGPYTVTASARDQGLADSSVSVYVEGNTEAPVILMGILPPATVAGTVRSSVDGKLLANATVECRSLDGKRLVTSDETTGRLTGDPPGNYHMTRVPQGTWMIRAVKDGWKTAETTVTVVSQQVKGGVNLVLQPEHVFGQGLQLISLPGDYGGQDAASLLDQPSGSFKSAYWLTDARRYAIYPESEAREFKRGKGMFVRFRSRTAFAKPGGNTSDGPFRLPVKTGWNMIGSVRKKQRIEWLKVKVQSPDGRTRTMQEAMRDGIIQAGLWGYQQGYFESDYMEPYAGYFVRALQDCTLVIPKNNQTAGVPESLQVGPRLSRGPAPAAVPVAAAILPQEPYRPGANKTNNRARGRGYAVQAVEPRILTLKRRPVGRRPGTA
jgi:Tol biopolymer transport system component